MYTFNKIFLFSLVSLFVSLIINSYPNSHRGFESQMAAKLGGLWQSGGKITFSLYIIQGYNVSKSLYYQRFWDWCWIVCTICCSFLLYSDRIKEMEWIRDTIGNKFLRFWGRSTLFHKRVQILTFVVKSLLHM